MRADGPPQGANSALQGQRRGSFGQPGRKHGEIA